jgi:hypothetical protein
MARPIKYNERWIEHVAIPTIDRMIAILKSNDKADIAQVPFYCSMAALYDELNIDDQTLTKLSKQDDMLFSAIKKFRTAAERAYTRYMHVDKKLSPIIPVFFAANAFGYSRKDPIQIETSDLTAVKSWASQLIKPKEEDKNEQ